MSPTEARRIIETLAQGTDKRTDSSSGNTHAGAAAEQRAPSQPA